MTENVQVLVAGGGVAGSMAAIAAARLGSSVALIERGGCLGGMWTAGLVGFTLDSGYKTGLLSEFLKRVHGELETGVGTIFEVQKAVLEAMCAESGVSLYYHSQVNHIETENRRIIKAEVISKSGNIEFIPESVIDATADGDIAVMAGCEYSYGRASDGKAQPMSMIALISGLDEKAEKYISRPTKDFWEARKPLKELFDSIGAEYSIGCPSIQPLCSGIYILSVNQEYGYSGCNVKELTAATVHARNEIYNLVKCLKKNASDVFGDIALVTTPECIGVREGRRIIGKYTVGLDDMINGRKQPDGICRVRYWVDIHSLDKGDNNGFTDDGIKAQPYDIPFRSLIPKDADNLLVSGRCISGDFYAHASYRVAGNMATVGEAAGKAAAYAAQKHVDVSKICYSSKDMTFFTDSPEN